MRSALAKAVLLNHWVACHCGGRAWRRSSHTRVNLGKPTEFWISVWLCADCGTAAIWTVDARTVVRALQPGLWQVADL